MANSRKLNSAEFNEKVAAHIVPLLPAHSSILIGLSGGVDSVVLLHVLHHLAHRYSWRLSALHVHHGISPNADAWENFCASLCAQHRISLHIERVDITPLRAQGIEAAARKLRHAAFAEQECDYIALAHHADDQAETMILQLLRGAGVRGAAAMPLLARGKGDSARVLRPLLHCSRREILDYAEALELHWIEDESNADDKYPRNYLRHHVMPALEQKFPGYRDTLGRSAQHFAEASSLLDELAEHDAAGGIDTDTLSIAALRALSEPRARNLLRYFLHVRGAPMPQTVQIGDMLEQLFNARRDAAVRIVFGDWELHRYQGRVHVLRAYGEFDPNMVLPWHGEAALEWPALNAQLHFKRSKGDGISLARLRRAPVTLRARSGGESLRPHPNASMRTLKNLLQEYHVPPWQRDRLPLLFCGDDLVSIPGVAIAAEYQASGHEAAIQLVAGQASAS